MAVAPATSQRTSSPAFAVGDRACSAAPITLVESSRARRTEQRAQELLHAAACPATGERAPGRHHRRARRRQEHLHRGARHASPPPATGSPCSPSIRRARRGGSILGDKTRMARLGRRPERLHPPVARRRAPSAASPARPARRCWSARPPATTSSSSRPSASARARRSVAEMVDFFLRADARRRRRRAAGHQEGRARARRHHRGQQGRRRQQVPAELAARDYQAALHLLTPASPNWTPPVVTCSVAYRRRHRHAVEPDRAASQQARRVRRVGCPPPRPAAAAGCGQWSRTGSSTISTVTPVSEPWYPPPRLPSARASSPPPWRPTGSSPRSGTRHRLARPPPRVSTSSLRGSAVS